MGQITSINRPAGVSMPDGRFAPAWSPGMIDGFLAHWPTYEYSYQDSLGTVRSESGDPVGMREGRTGGIDFVQSTTIKKPTYNVVGPASEFDGVDDLLQAVYSLSMGSKWLIAMTAWGKDGSDSIVLDELGLISGEFGMRIGAGENRQAPVPANMGDGSSFSGGFITTPSFASDSGIERYLGTIFIDADNRIMLYQKTTDADVIRADIIASGAAVKTVTRSLAWSAGDEIYVGARLYSGTLYLSASNITTGGTSLTESSVGSVGAFTGSTWLWKIGGLNGDIGYNWEGPINAVLTNDGSDASAITDRFNSGAGMAFGGDMGWAAQVSGNGSRHGENLVLSVGGNADGSAYELNTASGATVLLAGTATGRVDISPSAYLTTADPGASADGLGAATWRITHTFDSFAGVLLERWQSSGNQFEVVVTSSTNLRVYIASSGTDASNYVNFAVSLALGIEYKFIITFSAGTLALYYKTKDPDTRKFGAQSAPAPSVTGTIPATLISSARGYYFGRATDGTDGKLDDVCIWNGKALTSAEADADLINEPNPNGLSHWWPFDGDGTDVIGGLTASWTGTPAYADDGRHDLGRFERYTKSGQYYTDGVNDKITHGNYAALDGATYAKFVHIFTGPLPSTDRGLFERGKLGTDGQILAEITSAGALRLWAPTSATDVLTYGTWTGFFADGIPTHYEVEFDGSQATNATRLVVKKSTFDAATGTWSTLTAVGATSFTGTIPAALQTVATNTTLTVGARVGVALYLKGLHDRFACHAGSIPASKTPYESGAASYDIWCDYNGNANNAGLGGATYNGTVTGAIQWYDGRQPEGWTVSSGAEVDRATGSNQVGEGTFGVRVKSTSGAAAPLFISSASAATVGNWLLVAAQARETTAHGVLRLTDSFSAPQDNAVPTQATLANVGGAKRASNTNTPNVELRCLSTSAEAYFDNLRALQLATVSLSVSTSGVPSRVIWSASKDGVNQPYVYASVATDEKLEIGARNVAGTRVEDSSSGSISTGVHSIYLEWDGVDTITAYLDTVEVASVTLSGSYTGLDRLNLGGLPLFVEGYPFDERIGDILLFGGSSFAGSDAGIRDEIHNFLSNLTDGLAAV